MTFVRFSQKPTFSSVYLALRLVRPDMQTRLPQQQAAILLKPSIRGFKKKYNYVLLNNTGQSLPGTGWPVFVELKLLCAFLK